MKNPFMQSVGTMLLLGMAGLLAYPVSANETNTVKNGVYDWTLPESYLENRIPQAGDTIIIPADTEVYLDSTNAAFAASLALLNTMERVAPQDKWTSRLVITIAENESHDFAFPFTYRGETAIGYTHCRGDIVKRGGGTARWTTFDKLHAYDNRDLYTNLDIEEGAFALPSEYGDDPKSRFCYMGRVNVGANSVFETACHTNTDRATTSIRQLTGAGVITNRYSSADGKTFSLQITGAVQGEETVFSGSIRGAIGVACRASTIDMQTVLNRQIGTTLLGADANNAVELKVKQLSLFDGCSSAGSGKIHFTSPRARLTYTGNGDVTDRPVSFQSANATAALGPMLIDGGAFGGLTLNGVLDAIGGSKTRQVVMPLALTGTNTALCTLAASDYGIGTLAAYPGDRYRLQLIKEGSGEWLLKDNLNPISSIDPLEGLTEIREGTLTFDALREMGDYCSFGTATNCTTTYTGDWSDDYRLNYAFLFGGPLSTGAEPAAIPTLKFAGTNSMLCTTRPFAFAGDGRIQNDTDRALFLANAFALEGKTPTLVLDGSGSRTNVFADIRNGDGTLGVRKTGSGTWKLTGDLAVGGLVDVQSGRLIVRQETKTVYDRYRWTWKQAWDGDHEMSIARFGLFDADHKIVSGDLVERNDGDDIALAPGQAGCDYRGTLTMNYAANASISALFSTGTALVYGFCPSIKMLPPNAGTPQKISPSDPATWLRIYMRLPEGFNEPTSFDYANVWAGLGQSRENLRAFTLEGSVDGIHWETVKSETDAPVQSTAGNYAWAYDYEVMSWLNNKWSMKNHTNGCPIVGHSTRTYTVEINGGVKVAPGAVLEAEGEVTLSKLVVDAAGGGTVKGFTLAQNGECVIENFDPETMLIPFHLEVGESVANLSSWAVSAGGEPKPAMKVGVTATGLKILRRGLIFTVR